MGKRNMKHPTMYQCDCGEITGRNCEQISESCDMQVVRYTHEGKNKTFAIRSDCLDELEKTVDGEIETVNARVKDYAEEACSEHELYDWD